MPYSYWSSIGQDSHRFYDSESRDLISQEESQPLRLGSLPISEDIRVLANSDGDVLLHAVTNAVSGITGQAVLGHEADDLCKQGNKDSRAYLDLALSYLDEDIELYHLSCSIEAKRPKLKQFIQPIRERLAQILGMKETSVMITATTGEGLTGMGQGLGLQAICILTVRRKEKDEQD